VGGIYGTSSFDLGRILAIRLRQTDEFIRGWIA